MSKTTNMLNDCVCQRVRMTARAVTRAYDEALRPIGLRATQLAVLVAVAQEEAVSIAALSRLLGMDRSTLTRNLKPLEMEELVVVGAEGWHRSRTLKITETGNDRLRAATPIWESTQRQIHKRMGVAQWTALRAELDHLSQAAESLQSPANSR